MTPDQINQKKIAIAIGEAIIARILAETERDLLREEIARQADQNSGKPA